MARVALAGLAGVSALMALLWAVQRRTQNAGIVDVGWTFGVGALAIVAAIWGDGWVVRRVAIAGATSIWSARLGIYLLRDRVAGRPEDGRYASLRAAWGRSANARFFWFFQAQAVAALFFALPSLLASRDPYPHMRSVEVAALLLWLAGLLGERTADRQLERFKRDPAHRGRTCRAGLWRYSRHPNYFFEWMVWVSYALFASPSTWGALAFACPIAMLYLLFRVTGIPATEAHAVRSRADYADYQRSTSAFIPWMPTS